MKYILKGFSFFQVVEENKNTKALVRRGERERERKGKTNGLMSCIRHGENNLADRRVKTVRHRNNIVQSWAKRIIIITR